MVTLKIKLDFVYTYVYKKANQYINKIGYCYRLLRLKSLIRKMKVYNDISYSM